MIFDWNHYFDFAKELYSKKDQFTNEDACFRSVISRTYYSMHHQVFDHSWYVGEIPTGKSEGTRLINYLKTQKKEESRTIGTKLESLQKYRTTADYFRPNNYNTEKFSEASIRIAEELKLILDSLGK